MIKVIVKLVNLGIWYTLLVPIRVFWILIGDPIWRVTSYVILDEQIKKYEDLSAVALLEDQTDLENYIFLFRVYFNTLREKYAASASPSA